MLKNIPAGLTPELVKYMMEMGSEDELLIAGANYPVMSRGISRVCYVNSSVEEVLKDILELLPLSRNTMSATMHFEEDEEPELYCEIKEILAQLDKRSEGGLIDRLDKYPFINRAEKVYCAVITTDRRINCEIILTKGAV